VGGIVGDEKANGVGRGYSIVFNVDLEDLWTGGDQWMGRKERRGGR